MNIEYGKIVVEGKGPFEAEIGGTLIIQSIDVQELERAFATIRHQLLDLEALADELSEAFDRDDRVLVIPSRLQRFEVLDDTWLTARKLLRFDTLGELLMACVNTVPANGRSAIEQNGPTRLLELQELYELAVRLCQEMLSDEAVRSYSGTPNRNPSCRP